jgi:hypothetical protein
MMSCGSKSEFSKPPVRIAAFISIPKNASKTVLNVLGLGRNRDIDVTDSLVVYENHQRGSVLSANYDLGELFVFCFSRNPYDRCVSWYEYHRSLPPYKSMSFDAWIKNGLPHHWTRQNLTDYTARGMSPLLQYGFIENCKVDFIGSLENFRHDLNVVTGILNHACSERKLNTRFILNDSKFNTSERVADFNRYYTDETKEIVYALLEKDFNFFGYGK